MSKIDISAAKNLVQMRNDYEAAGIFVAFAALSGNTFEIKEICSCFLTRRHILMIHRLYFLEQSLEVINKCDAAEKLSEDVFFHSVPDAVAFFTLPPTQPQTPQIVVAHL